MRGVGSTKSVIGTFDIVMFEWLTSAEYVSRR